MAIETKNKFRHSKKIVLLLELGLHLQESWKQFSQKWLMKIHGNSKKVFTASFEFIHTTCLSSSLFRFCQNLIRDNKFGWANNEIQISTKNEKAKRLLFVQQT